MKGVNKQGVPNRFINEIGNVYGRLTVSQLSDVRINGSVCWVCICDCGKLKTVKGSDLRRGSSRSCGCLSRELASERCTKKRNRVAITCEYCGKQFKTIPSQVKNRRRFCCQDHLKASGILSQMQSGSSNSMWNGGTSDKNSPKRRLHKRISDSMRQSLRTGKNGKNGRAWESLVGYDTETLYRHLEKKFLPGMTWDNFNKWHIDHKIPVDVFNFKTTSDIDFKRCWDLKNLQPLWALDNIRKSNKIETPFQPSLAFGGAM